eukprot:1610583-Karenia_brevis.AAC.1
MPAEDASSVLFDAHDRTKELNSQEHADECASSVRLDVQDRTNDFNSQEHENISMHDDSYERT